MSYAGLTSAKSNDSPHLGGNITVGDPFTWCPRAWDYVRERFAIRSAMDLGSGSGFAAHYFASKGIFTVAVDGFRDNVDRSFYPTIQHDLTKSGVYARVDLVHCQEVVEHIEEKHLDNLLASLLCGRIILMTHALPGQNGYHHVNLQPPEYWVDHLVSRGCSLLEEDTRRVRAIASQEGAPYLAATGLLFSNNTRI
ncbi:hypothetical protein [Methylobacterium durans]|uniref:hypothetical protein n=1 Tax=Methylobacterium durans TaxID=2202825 RepID=UPI0013A5AC45|nr:hypothetical protein [Methylobacterium durans]